MCLGPLSALQLIPSASLGRGNYLAPVHQEHVKGTPEGQGSCFSIPHLPLQFLAPLSQPKTVSQLPEQMFVPASVCACKSNSSTDNCTWMRADFHIYVSQTTHSLSFLCVYPLLFLLTGCGLPLAARAQTEINKAASVFELPS